MLLQYIVVTSPINRQFRILLITATQSTYFTGRAVDDKLEQLSLFVCLCPVPELRSGGESLNLRTILLQGSDIRLSVARKSFVSLK